MLILFFLSPARAVGSEWWIVGVGEEVVDEVNFGDDVGASICLYGHEGSNPPSSAKA